MLSEVLLFLKNHLNAYLQLQSGWNPEDTGEDKVVFIDGGNMDPSPIVGWLSGLVLRACQT